MRGKGKHKGKKGILLNEGTKGMSFSYLNTYISEDAEDEQSTVINIIVEVFQFIQVFSFF